MTPEPVRQAHSNRRPTQKPFAKALQGTLITLMVAALVVYFSFSSDLSEEVKVAVAFAAVVSVPLSYWLRFKKG